MINLFVKAALKKVAMKVATDKSFRDKAKKVAINTKELNDKGELLKSLGKSAGRLKSIIKKSI
tara:strand:+ start:533 stop:721 length:189 start_codon:yes stop_codon:yes gene_type:complete